MRDIVSAAALEREFFIKTETSPLHRREFVI